MALFVSYMYTTAVLHHGNFPAALFVHTILPAGNWDLSALTVQIIFTQLYMSRTWCVWPYLLGTCTPQLCYTVVIFLQLYLSIQSFLWVGLQVQCINCANHIYTVTCPGHGVYGLIC